MLRNLFLHFLDRSQFLLHLCDMLCKGLPVETFHDFVQLDGELQFLNFLGHLRLDRGIDLEDQRNQYVQQDEHNEAPESHEE